MQRDNKVAWIAAVILVLIIGGTGKTGLPESDPAPKSPSDSVAPAKPGGGGPHVEQRLWQTDHWRLYLSDGSHVDVSESQGKKCDVGEPYPCR